MALFELLGGQHIQANKEWKPTQQQVEDAKRTGKTIRIPSVVYNKGDIVESELDLVTLLGANKFRLVNPSQVPYNDSQKTSYDPQKGDLKKK